MSWIGLTDQDESFFALNGLDAPKSAPCLIDDAYNALLVRGSLVIETRLPTTSRPEPLLFYARSGENPVHISLQAIPGGGLTLILDQGGEISHTSINHSEAGRMDILRITYSWDSPNRWGQLALERSDKAQVVVVPVNAPKPLLLADIKALMQPGADRFVAKDVLYMAVSTEIEPVGPMPSLAPETLVATLSGYRQIGKLRRGDLVMTATGRNVPVLQTLTRTVPARGHYRPVRLRAPYFGLKQDITVAPSQRLVLSGSEVEYLFGQESVLVPVCHLVGSTTTRAVDHGLLMTYTQVLLPEHDTLIAAGTFVESLFIGRMRRKRTLLNASILAGFKRSGLPDHGRSFRPVLNAFDALILAEQRAA